MKLRAIVFFAVFITVMAGLHYYVWARLVRDTMLPVPWRRMGTFVLLSLMAILLAALPLRRVLGYGVSQPLLLPAFVWAGMLFLLCVACLAGDFLRWIALLAAHLQRSGPLADSVSDPGRRLFLGRLITGSASLGAVGLTMFSARSATALSRVVTKRLEVTLRRLPARMDGFRIVQITDLHVGLLLDGHWLASIVDRVNALVPDLIVITGDLVDGTVSDLREQIAPVARLKAKHGVFFCTGNHEYYSGAVAWCEQLTRFGIRVMRNERVPIGDPEGFDLAGIDDANSEGSVPGHGPDLAAAVAGRDASRELILLAHQPKAIFDACEAGVGLQLSGHTHGGQIWPFNYLVYLQQPYVSGLFNHHGTQLYVSEGTGFWGPPMRLGSRAEITEITLRAGGDRGRV